MTSSKCFAVVLLRLGSEYDVYTGRDTILQFFPKYTKDNHFPMVSNFSVNIQAELAN